MKDKFLLLLIAAFAISSCKKDDGPSTHPVRFSATFSVDGSLGVDIPLEGTELTLTNKTNGQKHQTKADAKGVAVFESITPGTYDMVASLTISAEDYTELSGVVTEEDVHLNVNENGLVLLEDKSLDATLMASGRVGDFVFKQVYYAGSNTSTGASFRDAFIEIYNNSNTVLYADSLYFSQLTGNGGNDDAGKEFFLANGQYDWSKSLNMNASKDPNKDYVYAKSIFMIPSDATGKRYPVEPGQSIIIAGTALNHSKPYQNANGDKPIEVKNPELTIDLSTADFEVYLFPYERSINPNAKPFASDLSMPATDVDVVFSSGQNDLIMDARGREAYAIFKVDKSQKVKQWPKYPYSDIRELSENTNMYPQIPVEYVIDAVQTQHPLVGSRVPVRVPFTLDAGAGFVTGGQYSSQSIVRKTKKKVGNRRILQDTNNSTNDFGVLQKADPSKGESSFID